MRRTGDLRKLQDSEWSLLEDMPLIDQPNEPAPRSKSPLRAILPYTTALMVLAALYVAWIFYSRREESRKAEETVQQQRDASQKRVDDQIFGSGQVSFTTFEAADGTIKPGQTTQLCYGVVNARSVKIDPPIEQIKPSSRHCMDVAPKKTTTYTITADDDAGHTKTSSLTINVK